MLMTKIFSPLRFIRFVLLLALLVVSPLGAPESARADGPFEDEVPEVDLSDEQLLIDLFFDVEPDGALALEGHQFRSDIPYPAVATPWFWAARVITFDNRCSQLQPLRDPTVIRASDSQTHDEFWGKIIESTKLSVELVVGTDMQEVEIIDSSYESLGIFDVAVFIDSYCDENSDLTLCKNRKSKLILLDTDADLNQFDISILDDFDSTQHLNRIINRDGYRIWSENKEPVLAVDFDQTVLTWDLAHIPTIPFADTSRKAIYNGYRKNQDPKSLDPDSSLIIDLETPALGVGFKLGILNYEQLIGKDENALAGFEYLSQFGGVPPVDQVEKVFEQLAISKEPIVVHLSAYDPNGKLINQINKSILPVPGMYSFVGLVAPNNEIQRVDIDYRHIEPSAEEFLTDIVVFPLDAAKLPYRPLEITEQPCESAILLYTGEMSDFLPIDEAERLSDPKIDPTGQLAKPKTPGPTVQLRPTKTPGPTVQLRPTKIPGPTVQLTPTKTPEPAVQLKPTRQPGPTVQLTPTRQPGPTVQLTPTKTPEPAVQLKPTRQPAELNIPAVSCNSRGDQGVDLANIGWPMLLMGLFVYRSFRSSKR